MSATGQKRTYQTSVNSFRSLARRDIRRSAQSEVVLMIWIATRRTLSLMFLFTAANALTMPAQARQAKCLFEIDGVHYIGSVCEFTPIDKKGSFRIADTSGSGIEAEVKVTAPHEGIASWKDTHKTPSDRYIGDVGQAAGCWSDRSTYICAWSLDQDIYLGPRDKTLFVAYGERNGMDDEIESAVGIDTGHARHSNETKPTRCSILYHRPKDGRKLFSDSGRRNI